MATFNGERYVEAQLRSILDDLQWNDEIVVVDDASTDGTVARVKALGDPRVRLLPQQRNEGVRASFDLALRACRHTIVFLSDQDDVWLPGKRSALVAELAAGAVLALSDARVIDAEGRVIEESFMARRGGFKGSALATLVKNRYLGCTMAMRRELLDDVLPIPPTVPMHDMWIGLLGTLRGRVAYVDRPLIHYRRHSANVSPDQRAGVAQMVAWRWRLASLALGRKLRGPRRPAMEAP